MQTVSDPLIEALSLAPLFREPIESQVLVAPHHPGQASYIWDVRTARRRVIVRSPRRDSPPDEDFGQGVLRLFEANPSDLGRTAVITTYLAMHSEIPVPTILELATHNDRNFLIVEWLAGTPLNSFNQLPKKQLQRFGRHLARLHQQQFPIFGSPNALVNRAAGQPLDQFNARMKSTIHYLGKRYYAANPETAHWIGLADRSIESLSWPNTASPIMIDMDPSQFLVTEGQCLSALVDTELYVLAPRELELVGLEYLLNEPSAQIFATGYQQVAPLPLLQPYRLPFRLLLRLLSFQGPIDWTQWMKAPIRWQ